MRRVDRGEDPAPQALGALTGRLSELDRARAHYTPFDAKKGAFAFAAYKAPEVKARLEALFHGKCAYFETVYAASAPVDVEHYRPKGAVEGEPAHPVYWWLGMVWPLPSCIDCNRRRKQPPRFPPPAWSSSTR